MTEWPVLASMSVEDRNQLLREGRHRRFAKGETIFHHGDPADSLHLLATGRVAVRVLTPQGDQAILTVLGPGKVFGELALIDPHVHRTATITAIQLCETIMIGRKQFDCFGPGTPKSTGSCWLHWRPRSIGCLSICWKRCSCRPRSG
jgi:CRP-like cAMP-binding protein